jgi:hypothetical protein
MGGEDRGVYQGSVSPLYFGFALMPYEAISAQFSGMVQSVGTGRWEATSTENTAAPS